MLRNIRQLFALLLFSVAATAAVADTQYFHKKFVGRIDGRYAFSMDLKDVDGNLSGSYRYAGKHRDINLGGKIDSSGNFKIEEFDYKGNVTATFSGKLLDDHLGGTWVSARGGREMSVDAHQTSEIVIGSEREILTQAIGAYTLDQINGYGGANAMWETSRTKGRWESNVSNISLGRREASDIDLTAEDLNRLNSLTITVDKSLTVRLSVEGKVLQSIPYQDVRTTSAGATGDANQHLPSPSPAVRDEQLYLLDDADVEFIPAIKGSYLIVNDLDTASLTYAIVDKAFALQLGGEGTGGTSFTFRRVSR